MGKMSLNIAVQVISAAKLLNQLPHLPLQAVIRRIFPFQAWSINRSTCMIWLPNLKGELSGSLWWHVHGGRSFMAKQHRISHNKVKHRKPQKTDPSSTLSLADGEWLIDRCNEQVGGWHPTSQRSHWSYAHQRGESWDTWRNVGCQCGLFTPFSGSGIHVDPGAWN